MTAQSEAMQTASRNGEGPVRLAAFDFDGTSLDGNSPVMLVKHLAKLRMLNPTVLLRIGLWAAAYKLRLPQNEAWVRGLVFRAFAGKPKAEVDAFLHDFYDDCVAPHVREQARQAMDAWHEQGVTVICVSATFEPIIERAMRDLPFDYQISTRMKVNYDGTYACEVDGVPVDHRLERPEDMPAEDDLSRRVSADLKKRGFRFVGPVIVYSYLQGAGLINDHLVTCPWHGEGL